MESGGPGADLSGILGEEGRFQFAEVHRLIWSIHLSDLMYSRLLSHQVCFFLSKVWIVGDETLIEGVC